MAVTTFLLFIFIAGQPAKPWEKTSPDYVPSVFAFPPSHSPAVDNEQRHRRYARARERQRRPLQELPENVVPSEKAAVAISQDVTPSPGASCDLNNENLNNISNQRKGQY